MPDPVELRVNGRPLTVSDGTTVAAALLSVGHAALRRSVTGEWRGPLCGMGICFECRITIDGRPHVRGCQVVCRSGMDVRTDA
ncbi:MAG TPA: (2Fe-2S)-binding protein [Bryobacteraceae bacterium]|nr:(2Fe-2S)-binding protein [Bryobacteraceae bacterium]